MSVKSIMLVGISGQEAVLAGNIIGSIAVNEGYDVKMSEERGIGHYGEAERVSVRYGDMVYSPVIDEGEADIIIAFELLEAYRALPYLKKGGKLIVNMQKINTVSAKADMEDIEEEINSRAEVLKVDAAEYEILTHSKKAVGAMLMGMAAKDFGVPYEKWIVSIRQTAPERLIDSYVQAFEAGYKLL